MEVDEEGMRFALRTALQLGQMVSGKTKQQSVTKIRPLHEDGGQELTS